MSENCSYAEVRKIFDWKDNKSIRDAVKAGTLVRVRVSNSKKGWRITRASVEKFQQDRKDLESARVEFGYSLSDMQQMRAAKKAEKESSVMVLTAGEVTQPTYVNQFGDEFAPTPEWSEDPISHQMTPPGCFRDETDTLVCGMPSPLEACNIFHARCKLRGINPSKALFRALLLDGSGHWRVNDMQPASKPDLRLQYTPATAGGSHRGGF